MPATCLRTAPPVRSDQSGLAQALEFLRSSDVFFVWKLDRLGLSLLHLFTIITVLNGGISKRPSAAMLD